MPRRKPEPAPVAAPAAVVEQIPRAETFDPPEQQAAREREAKKLTALRERFCLEYVAAGCKNGTRAYLRATGPGVGYFAAATEASRLLKMPEVQARIRELTAHYLERIDVTAERILAEQAKVAFFDPADVLDFSAEDGAPVLKPAAAIAPEARAGIKKLRIKQVMEVTGMDSEGKPIFTPAEVTDIEFRDPEPRLRTLMQHKRMLEPEGNVNVTVTVTEVSRKLPEGQWAKKYGRAAKKAS